MSTGTEVRPGTLIVLEGLDKTGKTTQAKALVEALEPASTEHVHMPRGFSIFSDELYTMLESDRRRPTSGVARQLAHLACHAESVPRISRILLERAVVLDRWWWSTVAYGWYSGEVPIEGVSEDAFMGLIESIWGQLHPSVVFLFDRPHEDDANNSDPIRHGYDVLARDHPEVTQRVQAGKPEAVTTFILDQLAQRGLLTDSDLRLV